MAVEGDVDNSSSGYDFEGQQGILNLLTQESNIEIRSSEGEGYSCLPSESMQLLLTDQSETVCQIEKSSSDAPDRSGIDAQNNFQHQNEISFVNREREVASISKAHVGKTEVIDTIAANEPPTVKEDLADNSQKSNVKAVEHQADAENMEKLGKDETSIIGPAKIVKASIIDTDESEMLQRKEILRCVDQISSDTMASQNDTDEDDFRYGRETPASQGTYTPESEEYTMDISRFYRLPGQILSSTSSADGHRLNFDSKMSTPNSTEQELRYPAFKVKNHREYILKSGINAKLVSKLKFSVSAYERLYFCSIYSM